MSVAIEYINSRGEYWHEQYKLMSVHVGRLRADLQVACQELALASVSGESIAALASAVSRLVREIHQAERDLSHAANRNVHYYNRLLMETNPASN